MGSVINITPQSYSEQETAENWAGEFAKRIMEAHKTLPILEHPDGSVTEDKLSDEVKGRIAETVREAERATEMAHAATATADTAKTIAQSAKASADIAVNEAKNATNIAYGIGGAMTALDIKTEGKAEKDHVHNEYAKTTEVPTKTSELENDSGYLSEHQDISGKADQDYVNYLHTMINDLCQVDELKADKTTITTSDDTTVSFEFSANHNKEFRAGELNTLSFTFGDGEYAEDYISGLSLDSGATPTAIDYTDSGILNWVGTDCATSDGLSIFQPSANTHYDIVFYFNGTQFIGLVNGFVPATGNEAV